MMESEVKLSVLMNTKQVEKLASVWGMCKTVVKALAHKLESVKV